MSVVTDVVLCVGLGEEQGEDKFPAIDYVNHWLQEEHYGILTHLNGHEGGFKAWQVDVFGGAFNHLNIEQFVATLLSAPWDTPEEVQLLIKGEHDEVMELVNLFPSEYQLSGEAKEVRDAIDQIRTPDVLNAREIG